MSKKTWRLGEPGRPRRDAQTRILEYFEAHPDAKMTLAQMMRQFGVGTRRSMSTQLWSANQMAVGFQIRAVVVYRRVPLRG